MSGASSRHPWRVGVVIGAVLLIDVARVAPAVPGGDGGWLGTVPVAIAAEATDASAVDATDDAATAMRRAAEEAFASARAQRRAAERTLQQRAAATARAERATLAVDREVRSAEEQILEAVVRRWESEIDLARATTAASDAAAALHRQRLALIALRHQDDRVQRAIAEARVVLDERTIRAYKHGSVAASAGWMLGAAREAGSPGDLAAAMKHLQRLTDDGHLDVERLETVRVAIRSDLAQATRRRDRAVLERDRTRDDVEVTRTELERATDAASAAEALAEDRRRAADGVEARRLEGWQWALDAEAAAAARLEELRQREAAARDALTATTAGAADAPSGARPVVPARSDGGDPDVADEDGTLEDRRAWLGSRQRALARNRALAAEARQTDDRWACPVAGGGFVNDWGFPRSQLRRHQGTDVFADDGTPVLSPVDGTVSALDVVDRFDGRRGLGGVTVTVERGSERFYHAHLQGIAPGLDVGDRVTAGTVIGAVGRTGNARGTAPHLHFGWYVDDVAVNPYASLALACGDWPRPGSERDQPPMS